MTEGAVTKGNTRGGGMTTNAEVMMGEIVVGGGENVNVNARGGKFKPVDAVGTDSESLVFFLFFVCVYVVILDFWCRDDGEGDIMIMAKIEGHEELERI